MNLSIVSGTIARQKTDAAVLFLYDGGTAKPAVARMDRILGGMIGRIVKRGDFIPKPGNVCTLYPGEKAAFERLVLAGLGKEEDFTLDRLRHAAGKAAQAARRVAAKTIAFCADGVPGAAEETGQALAEGALLGLYRFLKYKTAPENERENEVRSLTIVTETSGALASLRKGAARGRRIAESACMVRDLVNHPAADMTPAHMASQAKDLAKRYRLAVRILERRDMQKLGMGALLGVAAGSVQPPKFIILEYRRGGRKPFIALVGKTITFDSGGISLKPAENMDRMKDDMAGGAAVLGAIRAAAELKLPLNIVGLLPATENMPSGSALKPGDVLRTMAGRTIEIVNTDAEGRLILSDALQYACRYKPRFIIDIATLTGACRVALGQEAAGMLGNDEHLKQMIRAAGEATGERVWELPLWEGYFDAIKSDIADMKNAGGREGGVITAACLLSKFVQNYPWVHLDIAAVALTDKDRPYTPKGATGFGCRLLTQFLRECAEKNSHYRSRASKRNERSNTNSKTPNGVSRAF